MAADKVEMVTPKLEGATAVAQAMKFDRGDFSVLPAEKVCMAIEDKGGHGEAPDEDDGDGNGFGNGDGDSQCKFDEFFLFSLRLVGILDPQWHFGSTLADRLAL